MRTFLEVVDSLAAEPEVVTFQPEEGGSGVTISPFSTPSGGLRVKLEAAGAILTDRDVGILAALLLAQTHAPELGQVRAKLEAVLGRR